ncbi:MAG TPA: stage III sporulation protein AE [Spirochaetia bacterium]|nr:stage III sporulation protein AE [Spirochaetia bacterium]
MWRLAFIVLAAVFWLGLVTPAPAAELDKQFQSLDLQRVQGYVDHMNREINGTLPAVDFRQLVWGLVQGKAAVTPRNILTDLFNYFFRELVANSSLLGQLILLAVVCAVLQNLQAAFESATTAKLSYAVSYLVLAGLAAGSFSLATTTGRNLVGDMVSFMQAILPVLVTLLVAVGQIGAPAVMSPMLFSFITVVGTVVQNLVLPLLIMAAVLRLASNLSEHFSVSRLAGLIQWFAMGVMGLMSTVFLGFLAVYGVAGAVTNGIAFRTARYATDALVPVVGGMLSDALGAVVGTSLLLKNAVGLAGIVVIALMITVPLLKMLALGFTYHLAGAVVQPVGDARLAECLTGLGQSLIFIFAAVAVAALMFFFTIAIVVGVGNLNAILH